jgi:hypothetical protein
MSSYQPAIDGNYLSVDVTCLCRGQKDNQWRNLLRFAKATQGNLGKQVRRVEGVGPAGRWGKTRRL